MKTNFDVPSDDRGSHPDDLSVSVSRQVKMQRNPLKRGVNSKSGPGAGVTKAPFANFSVSKFFDLAKVPVRFPESHAYLTGVTAAELRRHLPNMNAIFNS